MMDFQITVPEWMGKRFLATVERAVKILEYHFPTPPSDEVDRRLTVSADYVTKKGKVGVVDTHYMEKRGIVIQRYLETQGRVPNEQEIMDEIKDMEEEEEWT